MTNGPDIRYPVRLSLVGYYGYDNLGDHLMLEGLLATLSRYVDPVRVSVLTRPGCVLHHSEAVKTVAVGGLGGRLRRLASTVSSDAVIWGGGTCLYEDGPGGVEGIRNILRHIRLCHLLGKKYVLLGVGIGDLHTEQAVEIIRRIVAEADGLYVRDDTSAEHCRTEFGREPTMVMGDLAFLAAPQPDVARTEQRLSNGIETVAFCGTAYHAADVDAVERARSLLGDLVAHGTRNVVFVPMHQGDRSDHVFHRKVAASLTGCRTVFADYDTVARCVEILTGCDFLVGYRLHSVVLADLLGIPNIAVAYSPKVAAYVRKTGFLHPLRAKSLADAVSYVDVERVWREYVSGADKLRSFIERERRSAEVGVMSMLEMVTS